MCMYRVHVIGRVPRASCCLASERLSAVAKWRRRFYYQPTLSRRHRFKRTPVENVLKHLQTTSEVVLLLYLGAKPAARRSAVTPRSSRHWTHMSPYFCLVFSPEIRGGRLPCFLFMFLQFYYTKRLYIYSCRVQVSLREFKKQSN